MLVGEPFTRPAETTLDLISHHEHAILITDLANPLHETFGCWNIAPLPYHRFYNDSRRFAGIALRS